MLDENSVLMRGNGLGPKFASLIASSHKKYIDLNSVLPEDAQVCREQLPKKIEHMWLYGTEYFDVLSDAQRHEMAWMEVARDVSLFIHFEHIIPLTFSAYIDKYRQSMDSSIYEYMMIFCREELSHIMMFHRYLKAAGLPWYGMPEGFDALAKLLPNMAPELGIMYTLMIEWSSECAVTASVRDGEVDELTRRMWTEHHREEVRHIAFGKRIAEEYFRRAPASEVAAARLQLGALINQLHYVYNYNPDIATYLSFALPFAVDDEDAIHAIRTSAHNKRLREERFGEILSWCRGLGIL